MALLPSCVKEFILDALALDQRIDGRRPFDARRLNIKFAREDGAAEVQLGQTHVMSVVSAQLVQPYPERPNEGTLAVFTEFSPMADPAFESGRPGEYAVELGRVIDRGLRESRAVDTESLCVLAGKAVWALRVDIHILDNGGNLVDAANAAALAALLSFRRPECSIGGEDGQEVIVHPPEIREPLPLIIHHLPIAVTFAFFGEGEHVVMDPSFKEELVMGGRLTLIVNTHGDICAVQKGGGIGVSPSEIMRCLRIAFAKAADITAALKKAVETHEVERAQRKIRRHRNISSQEIVKDIKSEGDFEMKDAMGGLKVEKVTEGSPSSQDMMKLKNAGDLDSTSDEEEDDDSDSEEEEAFNDDKPMVEETESKPKPQAAESTKGIMFEGGASYWTKDNNQVLKHEKLSASHFIDEFDKVAEVITQAAGTFSIGSQKPTSQNNTEARSLSVKKERVDIVSNQQQTMPMHQVEEQEARSGSTMDSKQKSSQPLSLLDAVKKKSNVGKKDKVPKH